MRSQQEEIIILPRLYAEAALSKGSTFYDYEHNVNLVWGSASNYICRRKIGRGKYSQVFQGFNKQNSTRCVVKMLKPIKFFKINREVKILMALGGKCNCIQLLDLVKESEVYNLVFEHVDNLEYTILSSIITPQECKYYFLQMLVGLKYSHSMGIMHRDIKPQNVLIDHKEKKLRIIDWGLAEFYLPQKDYNVRVSSRYYKGPQLLVGYEHYHYSIDIWSLAVTMAAIIFRKEPFFKGTDNVDQLNEITKVLGTAELYQYIKKYHIYCQHNVQNSLGKYCAVKLQKFINQGNAHLATEDALDLLKRMMIYDHDLRPTVVQCIKHPYFDSVRSGLQ